MRSVLKQYWGYDSFRPLQEDIISSVLEGHDTLGLLPTGGGKSLTFQVPALMLPGVTLVVTPLISLMKDQVDNLADRGIRAVLFHSGLTPREKDLALTRCRIGKAKIAYVSPERLQNERFLAELRSLTVSLIVVDEAHCISQWGYDFRPSYLRISSLRRLLGPDIPVLALTASATPEVTADIMKHLAFREPRVYAKSFTRDNLSYILRYADVKEQMSNGLPEWMWSKYSAELKAMPLITLPEVSSTMSSLMCSPCLPTSLLVPKSVTRRVQNTGLTLPGPKGLNRRSNDRNSGVISLNVR